MEDAFYRWLASLGLSPLNTVLLGIIALLARQRIQGLVREMLACRRRHDRAEKSMIAAGIALLPIEEE